MREIEGYDRQAYHFRQPMLGLTSFIISSSNDFYDRQNRTNVNLRQLFLGCIKMEVYEKLRKL